jgi:hypothetical protein
MKALLLFLFLSTGLAQSLTGIYAVNDPSTGSSMTLKLIENPDKTLTGNLLFGDAPVALTGQITGPGMANAVLQDEETGHSFAFTLHLIEAQITLKASETGDEIILTRESADVPTLVQPSAISQQEGTLANDPKLEECLKFLEDEQVANDQQKIEDCQAYVNSVLGQPSGDETLAADEFDAEELAYCQDFLADPASVAEDPDEASYCQDYVKTYDNQNGINPSSEPSVEGTQSNPLDTSSNPLEPADPFAGTFRGNDIALILKGSSPYIGTLEFKGQTYPVAATSQGNTLAGTFETNGSSFDFTATLQDTTLTLESAGQTYPMLKDPSSN